MLISSVILPRAGGFPSPVFVSEFSSDFPSLRVLFYKNKGKRAHYAALANKKFPHGRKIHDLHTKIALIPGSDKMRFHSNTPKGSVSPFRSDKMFTFRF